MADLEKERNQPLASSPQSDPPAVAEISEVGLLYRAEPIAKGFQGRIPAPQEIRSLTEELGLELATTVLLRCIQEAEPHKEFLSHLRNVDTGLWKSQSELASQYEVTVVASNLFQSGRKWGDHVDEWRSWARALGFTTDWIETDPQASVSRNARLLLDYLAAHPHPNRILVTYGQGSSEFRFLLHKKQADRNPELANVRAWINVCGAFGGSSSSQYFASRAWRYLPISLEMKIAGRNPLSLRETSSEFGIWSQPLRIPPRMLVASLVGFPYRSQIPQGMHRLYHELGKVGPNDGAVSVYEACAHPGLIVPVKGLSQRAESHVLANPLRRVLIATAQMMGADLQ